MPQGGTNRSISQSLPSSPICACQVWEQEEEEAAEISREPSRSLTHGSSCLLSGAFPQASKSRSLSVHPSGHADKKGKERPRAGVPTLEGLPAPLGKWLWAPQGQRCWCLAGPSLLLRLTSRHMLLIAPTDKNSEKSQMWAAGNNVH